MADIKRSEVEALIGSFGIDTENLHTVSFEESHMTVTRIVPGAGVMWMSFNYADEEIDRRAPNCAACGHPKITHEGRCVVAWCTCAAYQEEVA